MTVDTIPVSVASGLEALQKRLDQDLQWLGLPARHWVPPREERGQKVLDTAVIGGGMAGLTLGAALIHFGIDTQIFDEAPEGLEGPWATTARMETLRSPKELTGPALGLPSLTFRAWFEAQYGLTAWNVLDKIPRLQWMDYLRWYRHVLKLPLHNQQRVTAVYPRPDGLVQLDLVDISRNAASYTVLARHVVLATGRDSLGGPWVPEWAHALPQDRWTHSADSWKDVKFEGKRIAVIGGGSSAMDAAATALENGAERVDLLIRRKDLPRINKVKGAGGPGISHGFWTLPDTWKWRIRHYLNVQQTPPPHGSTLRVSRHANAYFHFNAPVLTIAQRSDGLLRLDVPQGSLSVDLIIFCTGFRVNWHLRPVVCILRQQCTLMERPFHPPRRPEGRGACRSARSGNVVRISGTHIRHGSRSRSNPLFQLCRSSLPRSWGRGYSPDQ